MQKVQRCGPGSALSQPQRVLMSGPGSAPERLFAQNYERTLSRRRNEWRADVEGVALRTSRRSPCPTHPREPVDACQALTIHLTAFLPAPLPGAHVCGLKGRAHPAVGMAGHA